MEMYLPIVLSIPVLIILVILVREITRMYARLLDRNGTTHGFDPEAGELLKEAINEAVKLSEDRNRKRVRRTLEDMSDDEVAELLAGKREENGEST